MMHEEKAPGSGTFLPASLMYSCSGKLMHFYSDVDKVSYAVLFLASDESSYMTGSEVAVDGRFVAI
jgi:NAD(P)-dependent dehydrogenase (short-subunit alcohol dehydrogenase family)